MKKEREGEEDGERERNEEKGREDEGGSRGWGGSTPSLQRSCDCCFGSSRMPHEYNPMDT